MSGFRILVKGTLKDLIVQLTRREAKVLSYSEMGGYVMAHVLAPADTIYDWYAEDLLPPYDNGTMVHFVSLPSSEPGRP